MRVSKYWALPLAAAIGCGGAASSDLFSASGAPSSSDAGTTGDGGSSSSGGSTGSGSGSGGSTGSGSGSSGSGSSTGSSSGSTSSGSSSGSTSSSSGSSSGSTSSSSGSGSTSSSSGSGSGSSSGGTTDPGIRCGANGGNVTYCTVGTQLCCVTSNGQGPSFKCELAAGGVTCFGVPITCDDQADCPSGDVCCGTQGSNGRYTNVQCKSSCDPNSGEYEFCDPNATTATCAEPGTTCQPSQQLPGYSVCQ